MGGPPDELVSLIKETKTAARAVVAASTGLKEGSQCINNLHGGNCMIRLFRFEGAAGNLKSEMDAWSPYL